MSSTNPDMKWYSWASLYLGSQGDVGGVRSIHRQGDFWWVWEQDTYRVMPNADLEQRVYRWLISRDITSDPEHVKKVVAALGALVGLPSGTIPPAWLGDTPPNPGLEIIGTKGGLIDYDGNHIGDPTPLWWSNIQVSCGYEKGATAPLWEKFLLDRMEPQDIPALQEWAGHLFRPRGRLKSTALVLKGRTNSGKSTISGVFKGLIGPLGVSAIFVHNFADKFVTASMHGKVLNISDEVDVHWGKGAEASFKAFTGGQDVQIEGKFRPIFGETPTAKVMMNVNDWPKIKDESGAVYSRMLCIPMRGEIQKSEIDPLFPEKLLRELPGILNWALEGLRRFKAQGWRFSPTTGQAQLMKLESRANPTGGYISERIVENDKGFLPRFLLEQDLGTWAHEGGHIQPLYTDVISEILQRFPKAKTGRGRIYGEQVRGLLGVKLRGYNSKEDP